MKVFHALDEYSASCGTVLVMGMFDGLHMGHRALFNKSNEIKNENPVTVITFSGVFEEGKKALFTYDEKAAALEKIGADFAVFIPVDEKLKNTSPDEFIAELKKHIKIEAVVVGFDFTFGKGAKGDADTLKQAFKHVYVVDKVEIGGEKVSSSKLREFVKDGNMENYLRFCSVPYSVSGKVERGRGVGRENSIPTVNISVDKAKLVPKCGVYATKVKIGKDSFISVSNLGTAPTFGREHSVLETHILDYNGELYGKYIEVAFFKLVRPVKKFENAKCLYSQIDKDIEFTASYFRGLQL